MPVELVKTVFAFAFTLLVIWLTAPVARKIRLMDVPGERKNHVAETPLTGGIAIFLSLTATLLIWEKHDPYLISFLAAACLLVVAGAVDDRHYLKVRYRIVVEIIAASVMIFGAHLWVGNLGNLLGFGAVHMPFWVGYLFTLVAVFGVINAINMIDGMDGLAAGVTLGIFILLLLFTSGSRGLSTFGLPMAGALLAFLISNTGVARTFPKVFLGDAGSKLLGLSIVWVLIETARVSGGPWITIRPATALYLIAIPLMDMVDTTIGRVRRGVSPFTADRSHLHHVLSGLGLSKPAVVFAIISLSLVFNITGIAMTRFGVAESIQFGIFFLSFFIMVGFKNRYGRGKNIPAGCRAAENNTH